MSFVWIKPKKPWVQAAEDRALAEAVTAYINNVILARKPHD